MGDRIDTGPTLRAIHDVYATRFGHPNPFDSLAQLRAGAFVTGLLTALHYPDWARAIEQAAIREGMPDVVTPLWPEAIPMEPPQ